MAPSTIGILRAITEYIIEREENNKNCDKSTLAILPYLQREWRGWTENVFLLRLHPFKVGIQQNIQLSTD